MKNEAKKSIREFESPLPHENSHENLLKISKFSFVKNYSDKTVPINIANFKGLKLFKGERWYVEYYYKVPEGLLHLNENKEWKRFRVFEDINRRKGDGKEKYAALLFNSVKFALEEDGYNPFEKENNLFIKKIGPALTMIDAIQFFKENIGDRGLDDSTLTKYKRTANYLENYLIQIGKKDIEPGEVDNILIEECLNYYKRSVPWSNRNYNNSLGFLSIMFNFLVKKKKLKHNPCEDVTKLKQTSYKHRYYDDKTLPIVINELKKSDPYLFAAAQFVYYAGIRSSKELIGLQVGDLLLDRNRIRLRAEVTKGDRDDYILLDPKLKAIIEENGFTDYPSNYFVFTYHNKPNEKASADDFLQKRFRAIRGALKLGEDYTLYSFKHTRAVHLLIDGAQPVDIMQLFRHTDLTATTKYIRDLGFDLNAKFTDKSRDL